MRIEKALVIAAWGGAFNEDLAAVTRGRTGRNGFNYLGEPVTPGFDCIKTPAEAGAILLLLDDGQIVTGDCLSVQYAGAAGRAPRFNHATQIPALQQVCDYLTGLDISSLLDMCHALEAQTFDDGLNRTAAFYGVTQAFLYAVAAAQRKTGAEVLAEALGSSVSDKPIPIYVQCGEDRHHGVDKAIIRRADVLPHGLINTLDVLGDQGKKLQEYVSWIVTRLGTYGGTDYRPEIHIDVYGLIGEIFDHDAKRIAQYAADLGRRVGDLQFCLETPVLMANRAAQIDMFGTIRHELHRLGSNVRLIADEWANDLIDIHAFVEAGATHMINVKSPDLGSIHHAAQAVLDCKAGGVRPILGGSCNDSDVSSRAMCHVGLATDPAWILARPGMGMDEGFQIVHNEMARTLAVIVARQEESIA